MLTLYRRHKRSCQHRSMRYRRCHCPIWVYGTHGAKRIRATGASRSLRLRTLKLLEARDLTPSRDLVTYPAAIGVRYKIPARYNPLSSLGLSPC